MVLEFVAFGLQRSIQAQALREMVCRGPMLALERAGHIKLPAIRFQVRNHLVERERAKPVVPDNRTVHGPLHALGALEHRQVRRTLDEQLLNSLIEQYPISVLGVARQ